MLKSDSKKPETNTRRKRAVALSYDDMYAAPVIVASGMGHMAEKIVEVACENGVPVYEDNSLATVLSQMELGKEIPEELYSAIVEIYIYFLNFDPQDPEKYRRERAKRRGEVQGINEQEQNIETQDEVQEEGEE